VYKKLNNSVILKEQQKNKGSVKFIKMQSINIIFKNELNINVLNKNICSVIFEQMINKQKESS